MQEIVPSGMKLSSGRDARKASGIAVPESHRPLTESPEIWKILTIFIELRQHMPVQ
jgi:hypothetical protein